MTFIARLLVSVLFLSLMLALFLLHFVVRVVFSIVDWAYNGLADKASEL